MTCTLPEVATTFERREHKFPLGADLWPRAVEWARQVAPVERFDGVHERVHIRTTYLDTAGLDSYREYVERVPVRRKIRVRQYGYGGHLDEFCWLEVKVKYHDISLKRRLRGRMDQVAALLSGEDIAAHVAAQNASVPHAPRTYQLVREAILEGALRPVVRVDYERIAFQDPAGSPVRVTLDRNIHFLTAQRPAVRYSGLILEVKFSQEEPVWLPQLFQALSIGDSSRFSKYARAIGALGLNGHG